MKTERVYFLNAFVIDVACVMIFAEVLKLQVESYVWTTWVEFISGLMVASQFISCINVEIVKAK